jgi:hypothetical protein
VAIVIAGLGVLIASSLASAVAGATVFGSTSRASIRVGLSLPHFLEAIALLFFAAAAFRRLDVLTASRDALKVQQEQLAPTTLQRRFCTSCAAPVDPEDRFCTGCGRARTANTESTQ